MLQKLAELVEKIEENPDWFFFGVTMGIFTIITAIALILLVILVRALVCL